MLAIAPHCSAQHHALIDHQIRSLSFSCAPTGVPVIGLNVSKQHKLKFLMHGSRKHNINTYISKAKRIERVVCLHELKTNNTYRLLTVAVAFQIFSRRYDTA